MQEVDTRKARPVELRKALEVVHMLKKAGIPFVPIPFLNEEDRNELLNDMCRRLTLLEEAACK